MAFHLDSDAVSLVALIVALIALLIAFLQVIQQYAATGSDYRRCSARTMGGWAKHTKRVFVLGEIRYEIVYAVPHLGGFLNYTTSETLSSITGAHSTNLSLN